MKGFLVIAALLLPAVSSLHAQDNFREKYEAFRKQSMQTYTDFRRECNDRYVEFMKHAWESYHACAAVEQPKEEPVPPVVIEDGARPQIKDRELTVVEVVPIPAPAPRPRPIAPIKEQPVEPVIEEPVPDEPVPVNPIPDEPVAPAPVKPESAVSFTFFGTPMSVRADEALKFTLKSTSGRDVAAVWEKLSGHGYDNTLYDCLKARDEYRLCDWAYLLMLLSFSDNYLGYGDESMLMTAYLFSQSGYKMRLGLSKKGIALLFGTKHQIYGAPYYEIDGEFYYQLNGQEKEMEVVNYAFPNEKPLSLVMEEEPAFAMESSEVRPFSSKSSKTSASCKVNKNLVQFFSLYPSSQLNDNPMTRWALYADTPLDSQIKEQLYPSLREAIAGKSEADAAGILLNFVQTAFVYKLDDDVWGADRAFFSEETLFYPYCDCEDRSIFYSRLVRDLLGLNVILVYYPGHLATAVKFNEQVSGDYLVLDSGRYLVCDPTYVGAPIGLTMPGMDNSNAKVILLN